MTFELVRPAARGRPTKREGKEMFALWVRLLISKTLADDVLLKSLQGAFNHLRITLVRGATWTTDAPFHETAKGIAVMQAKGQS